ncbi:MAG: ribonuclease HII [Planctomycetota bacterium]|jgi:ribonuclease HII
MLKQFFNKKGIEAGLDEAGRGCLAGPVCAAAVILPKDFYHPLLNDSKLLTEKKRELLRPIIEKEALDFAVVMVNHKKIDKINILNASILAMQKAVDKLKIKPTLLLIDGNRFKQHKKYLHETIIKGDSKFASIAAASVLAKTYRDDYMQKLHKKHPEYTWNNNKGYPTKAHRKAIVENGVTDYHRMTFRLLPE